MPLLISPRVRNKLQDPAHSVTEDEIMECFANRDGLRCIDTREEHRTDPQTQWFVSQTDRGRRLKVCFMFHASSNIIEIKSAYQATDEVTRIYLKYAT